MAADKDALSNLKIAKNTYLFSQRKRYAPVEHYSVKRKTTASPMEQLMARFYGVSAKPPKGGRAGAKAPEPVESPLVIFAKVGLAALFLLLLLISWVIISAPETGGGPPAPAAQVSPADFEGSFDARIIDAHMLSYGSPFDAPTYQPYALIQYAGSNLSSLSLDARLYENPPSRQVFLLRFASEGADTLPQFGSSLEENLKRRGVLVSDIGIDEIAQLPGGCTLVVPTGLLPAPLMGNNATKTPSMFDLAARGITVIYIGLPFDKKMLDAGGSYVAPPAQALNDLGLDFDTKTELKSSDGLRLQLPLYGVQSRKSAGGYPVSTVWGSISKVAAGRGQVLLIPQNLDGGWQSDGNAAGEDIARLIDEEPYISFPSGASVSLPVANDSTPQYSTILLDTPTGLRSGTVRLKFNATDLNGVGRQMVRDWPVSTYTLSGIFVDKPVLLPKFLGGGKLSLTATLPGPGPCTKLYLELVQNSTVMERYDLEQRCTPMNDTIRTASVSTRLGPGTYLLRLSSDESRNVYAATAVQVQDLKITPEGKSLDQKAYFYYGKFNFSFTSSKANMTVPYVKVSVQGRRLPVQEFRDQSRVIYDAGTELAAGNYTFVFEFEDGYRQAVDMSFTRQKAFWEQPQNLALMGIAAVQFFIIFVFLRKPDQQLYSLDIPDFPPQTVTKIALPAEQILSVFEQVNKTYAWERMPLKEEEIRNGFRKIIYNGKSVVIGDYNLQHLLQRLSEKGLVQSDLGYWAPKRWTRESGLPMARMAMFRGLRDLFVANAVRFSRLGAVGGCDVKILIGNDAYFLHFYDSDIGVVSRALKTAREGYTWIVFRDAHERAKFSELLQSSEPQLIALKMEIEGERVSLLGLEEAGEMLKKLKVR